MRVRRIVNGGLVGVMILLRAVWTGAEVLEVEKTSVNIVKQVCYYLLHV